MNCYVSSGMLNPTHSLGLKPISSYKPTHDPLRTLVLRVCIATESVWNVQEVIDVERQVGWGGSWLYLVSDHLVLCVSCDVCLLNVQEVVDVECQVWWGGSWLAGPACSSATHSTASHSSLSTWHDSTSEHYSLLVMGRINSIPFTRPNRFESIQLTNWTRNFLIRLLYNMYYIIGK